MSVFQMTAMRASLNSIAVRPSARPQPRLVASLPAFDGLNRASRLNLRQDGEASLQLSAPQNGARWFAMRHRRGIPRLGRPADQRKALIRGLVTEVLRHGKITTTKVKAKAIRKYVDKMIGLAKRGDLHARRQALGFVFDKDLVASLFDNVPKRYGKRDGGYCRVIPEVRVRRGDGTVMAVIELV